MILENQNILFFTRTMGLGGTENVVLQLCEILKPLVNSITVCSCGGINVEKLSQMDIKHYTVPDIENKSPCTIIKCMFYIRKIIKNEKITIIHTHHRMAAFYVSIMQIYKNCKFINTCHNVFYDKKALTRFSYKHCNLIACGEMVKKNLVTEYNIPNEQITTIHNAVKSFDDRVLEDELIKKLHLQGCFVIGNVGRLSKQKGMEYYIYAIPNVMKKHRNARFVLIGSGEEELKLKKIVKTLGVEEYVFFMGYRDDVQNIISQLDLVVLSSLWEGLPLIPIEAYSVGKTVVATNIDGTIEIVNDMINGILVPVKDSNVLSNAICLLINNKELREKLERNAYKTFLDRFSFAKYTEKIVSYYSRLLQDV